jgi:Lon protease-like protein
VDALREFREKTPYPRGLAEYMPPDTNHETLASVSYAIESRLADDRLDESRRVAEAAVELLHTLATRAAEIDPQGGDLAAEIESARRDLREAWDEHSRAHQ